MTDAPRGRSISFEFFPPQTPEAAYRLWHAVERLAPLGPKFVSVTYGAGGTTRDRTKAAIRAIIDRARLTVAGHLTCVGATREETLAVAREYARLGVRSIVALRGDPPKGQGRFAPHPGGYASSADLVAALAADGWSDICVSAYPEIHPEATSPDDDIEALKRKVDAGATRAITQFFFDIADFLRLRDRAAAAGIPIPILPGILPIENFEKMSRFAAGCGARIPASLVRGFANAATVDEHTLLATAVATSMADRLFDEGVGHLHFYTLNNPDLTYGICRALGFEGVPLGMRSSGAA